MRITLAALAGCLAMPPAVAAAAAGPPVYLAACAGERTVVLATFTPRGGLKNLPASRTGVVAAVKAATWFGFEGGATAGMKLSRRAFAKARVRPASRPKWNKAAEMMEDVGEPAQVVLAEGCAAAGEARIVATELPTLPVSPPPDEGSDEPAGPCAEVLASSDPPPQHDGDQDTTTVEDCRVIELRFGRTVRRLLFAWKTNTQGAGSSSAWIEVTDLDAPRAPVTIRVDLHNRSGC